MVTPPACETTFGCTTHYGFKSTLAIQQPGNSVRVASPPEAAQLRDQLARLGDERRGRGSSLKGRKVAVKYRDESGNTWAGRRSATRLAAREAESRCKAGRLFSQNGGFPQGFAQETPQGETLSVVQNLR
jgi:hypothetical protein